MLYDFKVHLFDYTTLFIMFFSLHWIDSVLCVLSFYPCAVMDNMLGPVRFDIVNKRTRGCSGKSPSYFAEWKTILLTWMQHSWPSFPESGFAVLVTLFSRNSKTNMHFLLVKGFKFKPPKRQNLKKKDFHPQSTPQTWEILLIQNIQSMLKCTT